MASTTSYFGGINLVTPLAVLFGGTGQSSFTSGNLIYGVGTGALQNVATGTITCSGTVSCGAGSYVVGANITITGSGGGGSGAYPFPGPGNSTGTPAVGFLSGLYTFGSTTLQVASSTSQSISGSGYINNLAIGSYAAVGQTAAPSNGLIVSGNVGIGTTSPTSLLSLYSASPQITAATSDGFDNRQLSITGAGAYGDSRGGGIELSGNEVASVGGRISLTAGLSGTTGVIQFNTGGTETMRLTSGGSLGIGTTSPMSALALNSGQLTVPIGSASAPSLAFGNSLTTGVYSPGINQISIATNGAEAMNINATKQVVFDGTQITMGNLRFGDGSFPGSLAGMWDNSASDLRLAVSGTDALGVISSAVKIPAANDYGWTSNSVSQGVDTAFSRLSAKKVTLGSGGGDTSGTLIVGTAGVATSTPFSTLSVSTSAGTSPFSIGSSTASYLIVDKFGNVGISSTSPGSVFSIGGILNATTATTTYYSSGGIDFASSVGNCPITVAGTCLTSTITQASAYKQASKYATAAILAGTPSYANGTNGVGATLTELGSGALSVDGSSPAAGDRILVKNEASALTNGIYTVTATGSGIASYILTRATDFNSQADVFPGVTTYIISGTAPPTGNLGTSWSLTTAGPITIGTTALNFAEASAGGITAGNGIAVSGSTVSFDLTKLPVSNLILTYNGTQLQATGTNGGLTVDKLFSTSTATSTFAGPVQTTNIAASAQSTGCAQFGAGGYLLSTGTNCPTSTGSTVVMYGDSVLQAGNTGTNSTTSVSVITGHTYKIEMDCGSVLNSADTYQLQFTKPGGGSNPTTTLDVHTVTAGMVTNAVPVTLSGFYTASSTGTLYIAFNDGSGNLYTNCKDAKRSIMGN